MHMATTPRQFYTGLPTPLVWEILELLPLRDVRNLRLTCRWFEHQTSKPFAKRFYGVQTIAKSERTATRLAFTLQCLPLAAGVRTLAVDFCTDMDRLDRNAPRLARLLESLSRFSVRRQHVPSDVDMPTVTAVLAQLPNLQELIVSDLSNRYMGDKLASFDIRSAILSSGAHLTSISLWSCELSSHQLRKLLDAAGPTLQHIRFKDTRCLDDDDKAWLSILQTLYHEDLHSCHLEHLLKGPIPPRRTLENWDKPCWKDGVFTLLPGKDPNNDAEFRIQKWLRGSDGRPESYIIQPMTAMVHGQKAVKAALELILGEYGVTVARLDV